MFEVVLVKLKIIIIIITKHRLTNYLNKNKILHKYQFGFRKGYSTKLALLEITKHIRKVFR